MSLVVGLIGQRSRDVIGRFSAVISLPVKTVNSEWCVSIRLLLVKSPLVYC